jgi:hypothetical protein
MTVQTKIRDIFKFVLYTEIVNDIYKHYNRNKDDFYTGNSMNICITLSQLFKEMIRHGRKNGVSKVAIFGFFKNRSNIYSLISDMKKSCFFSFTFESIEDYTEILGYNEYKRGKIDFFRIAPVKGANYNRWKWIEIGKGCRLKLKGLYKTYRFDLSEDQRKEILR